MKGLNKKYHMISPICGIKEQNIQKDKTEIAIDTDHSPVVAREEEEGGMDKTGKGV